MKQEIITPEELEDIQWHLGYLKLLESAGIIQELKINTGDSPSASSVKFKVKEEMASLVFGESHGKFH